MDFYIDLNKLKLIFKKILIVFCVVWILLVMVIMFLFLYVLYIYVGNNEFWFVWNGFLIVFMIIMVFFVCGVWFFLIFFICVISLFFEYLFDEFFNRILFNYVNFW